VSSIGTDISATTSVAMPEFDLAVTTRSGRTAANTDLTLGVTRPGEAGETRLTPTYRTNADGVVHVGVPGPLKPGFARNGVYTLKWYGPHPDPILTQKVSVSSKPKSLVLLSGGSQQITAGARLAPIQFEVRDALGLRARGATLRLDDAGYLGGATVTDDNGLVTVQSGPVEPSGTSSFNLYLTEPGPFGAINVGYVNVTYNVVPGPVDDALIYGDDQSVPVNTAFTPISVRPIDAYDNYVPGVAVTFTAIAGAGGASGTVTPTGEANGAWAATVTANGTAGEWYVRAEVAGLGTYDFTLTNT
jgi:hypothetical protein